MGCLMDEAFLRAVCESPHDDGPRLVYADWLEEHGRHERAELIRIQIELSHLGEGEARQTLGEREVTLLGRHGQEWASEVPALEGVVWDRVFPDALLDSVPHFIRGFQGAARAED